MTQYNENTLLSEIIGDVKRVYHRKVTDDTGNVWEFDVTADYSNVTLGEVMELAFKPRWISKQRSLRPMTKTALEAFNGKITITMKPQRGGGHVRVMTLPEMIDYVKEHPDDVEAVNNLKQVLAMIERENH